MKQKRSIFFYENHFREFYLQQNPKVQKKILWTLQLIETIERIPELYFKHIENSDGLYEIGCSMVVIYSGSSVFLKKII